MKLPLEIYGTGTHQSYEQFPSIHNVYFMLPLSSSKAVSGPYTPKVVIPRNCPFHQIKTIITQNLPSYPDGHSIKISSGNPSDSEKGWYCSSQSASTWLDADLLNMFKQVHGMTLEEYLGWEWAFCVSVKVFDKTKGYMVPIDPFPSGTRFLPFLMTLNWVTNGIPNCTLYVPERSGGNLRPNRRL